MIDIISKLKQINPETIISGAIAAILAAFVIWIVQQLKDRIIFAYRKVQARIGTIPLFSEFAIKSYFSSIQSTHGVLTNNYLYTREKLSLDHIFVPLRLKNRNNSNIENLNFDYKKVFTCSEQKRIVILAEPGGGKTTLLKAIASGISSRQWEEFYSFFPIYVQLSQFSGQNKKLNLYEWIVRKIFLDHHLKNHDQMFDHLINDGKVILLLDGLDEVHVNKQSEVLHSIINFMEMIDLKKNCRILLTCREQNYNFLNDKGALLREGFIEYYISELREYEIEQMVFNRQKHFKEKNKNPEHFLQEIRSNPGTLDLHRIPFLLTVSIALYLNRREHIVPHKIEDFYNESIKLLILRRDTVVKEENNELRIQDKISFLQRFALDQLILATENDHDFESFQISNMIVSAHNFAEKSLNFSSNQSKDIINEFYRKDGLIKKLGEEHLFAFAHRSFHEFLAAKQLFKLGKKGYKKLIANLKYTSWHQVAVYYSSIHDNSYASKVIDILINRADNANKEVDKIILFDLLSKCLAVFDKSFISIYQKALNIITKNIQATQQNCRNELLIKLLIIGRNTPEKISKQVEDTFRQHFDFENPHIMAKEISRLNPIFSLSLLNHMVNSDSDKQHRAALIGLSEIDSINKIQLLWQLLDCFELKKDVISSAEARRQLFIMIEHNKDAVNILNNLGSRLFHVSRDIIVSAYPFIENNKLNNFSKLIGLEKINNPIKKIENFSDFSSWKRFLYTALTEKSSSEEAKWQSLPIDERKSIRRIKWQTIGRILNRTGLSISLGTLVYIYIDFLSKPPMSSYSLYWKLTFPIGIFFIFSIIYTPIITIGWFVFYQIIKRLGWSSHVFGIANEDTQYMLSYQVWKKPNSFFQKLLNLLALFISSTIIFLVYSGLLLFPNLVSNPIILGHSEFINSVSFSPDGKKFLTGSSDGTAILWDSEDCSVIHEFKKHKFTGFADRKIDDAKFSLDAKRIYTRSDNDIFIWDLQTAKIINNFSYFKNEKKPVDMIISPNLNKILVRELFGGVIQINVKTKKVINSLEGEYIFPASYSPDEKKIVGQSVADDTVILWDANTGRIIHRLNGHNENIININFSSDGKQIISKSRDNMTILWDIENARLIHKIQAELISPNWKKYITKDKHGNSILKSSKNGSIIKKLGKFKGRFEHYKFSPDGERLIAWSTDYHNKDNNIAILWDTNSGEVIKKMCMKKVLKDSAFTLDGKKLILYNSWNNSAIILNTKNGDNIITLNEQHLGFDLIFSKKGDQLLTSGYKSAIMWDVATGQKLYQTPIPFYAKKANKYEIIFCISSQTMGQ